MLAIDKIVENFEFLDNWDDRYSYLIELGRALDPLPEDAHTDTNRVRGCVSQVWLETRIEGSGKDAVLWFKGDSDALIVKGLISLVFAVYSGHTASDIVHADVADLFKRVNLSEHLTRQRSDGLRAMILRIKKDATQACDAEGASHAT